MKLFLTARMRRESYKNGVYTSLKIYIYGLEKVEIHAYTAKSVGENRNPSCIFLTITLRNPLTDANGTLTSQSPL